MQSLAPADIEAIAYRLGLRPIQVQRTLELLAEGNTVPFIGRYRRDDTDGLSEGDICQIRALAERYAALSAHKSRILRAIEARGKLTPELRERILAAATPGELEDLSFAFRANKKGPAAQAWKKGLGPLAEAVWEDRDEAADLSSAASQYVGGESGFNSVEDVIQGVEDILVQRVAENADVRSTVRRLFNENAQVATRLARKPTPTIQRVYGTFAEYRCPLQEVPSGRAYHIVRGERRKILAVSFELDEDACVERALAVLAFPETHRHLERLKNAARRAVLEVILPQIRQGAMKDLQDRAREFQLRLAERHLRRLLMQPPLKGERILAIDPGYRTGCKCVALDADGNPHDFMIVYPHEPLHQWDDAKAKLVDFIRRNNLTVAAVGNGIGCRETEELLAQIISEALPEFRFTIVNEAGADSYAKSPAGREEFPEQPPEFRSAVSVGRRLLDPLSEFVKIPPAELCGELIDGKANDSDLESKLQEIVALCVNEVGADANRANVHLLKYISGLNLSLARSLVKWREQHGGFQARRQFLLVDKNLDERRFIQCSGFLKIFGGENPLEATWIHPEHYDIAASLLEKAGAIPEEVIAGRAAARLDDLLSRVGFDRLADELGVGRYTLRYIVDSLKRPFDDPRRENRPAVFKQKILDLSDLQPGMELDGVVQNIVDFGAFVDVGAKITGLVHISRMSQEYISDPHEAVVVGEPVRVWVHEVDIERQRLALSMIPPGAERGIRPRRRQEVREERRPRRRPRRPRPQPAEVGAAEQVAAGAPASGSNGSVPTTESRPAASRTATPTPRQTRQPQPRPQRRERKPRKSTPVEIPAEAASGKVPLRSFAELKALWEQLESGESDREA